MKNIIIIALLGIIGILAIYFFKLTFSSNSETFLTAEGKWIAEKNSSDQRITDYYDIEKIILSTNYNKKSSMKKNAKKLMVYAEQYDLYDAQRRIETIQKNMDVVYSSEVNMNAFYNLIPFFADCLIGEIYAEGYECQYTLPVDTNKYINLMSTLGYSHEKESSLGEIHYRFSKNEEYTGSIYEDLRGNVKSVNVGIDISPFTKGFATEIYHSYTDDERIAADASNAMNNINNLSDIMLTADSRLNFLCSENEIIQIYEFLRSLTYENLIEVFSETISVYHIQTEEHVVGIFFEYGKVSISEVWDIEFYNNPIFPDVCTLTPQTVKAKKVDNPSYTDLGDYITTNEWDYSYFYICPSINRTINDSTETKSGHSNVVTYEFDTYDNKHVVVDELCIDQQVNLEEPGDYGDVELEQVAPGRDIIYLSDGERYYIEDYSRKLITITIPME